MFLHLTQHTHTAPPWACGNLVSCLKSGESSWEGWARYVQQTVEPAGQWAVLSLFTNHCQTPVPGLLLPLTHTHFTRSHSTLDGPRSHNRTRLSGLDLSSCLQVAEYFKWKKLRFSNKRNTRAWSNELKKLDLFWQSRKLTSQLHFSRTYASLLSFVWNVKRTEQFGNFRSPMILAKLAQSHHNRWSSQMYKEWLHSDP